MREIKETVFIADDEANIREGLKCIIDWEKLGFTICGEAGNGEDALRDILRLKPSLVLIDMRMPKLYGLEVLEQAQAQGFNGTFVILSGYSDFKYAQTAMKYDVKYYLKKPLENKLIQLKRLARSAIIAIPYITGKANINIKATTATKVMQPTLISALSCTVFPSGIKLANKGKKPRYKVWNNIPDNADTLPRIKPAPSANTIPPSNTI